MQFMDKQTLVMVGERVKKLRDARGWSQAYLEKKSGVSQKTISNIERGGGDRRSYTLESLAGVCDALGVKTWQILLPDKEEVVKLINNYERASANGRHNIDRVAELEARYAANE